MSKPEYPAVCPVCGSDAVGQRDYTPGLAMIDLIGETEDDVEWAGGTEMFWDEQVPQDDPISYGCLSCGAVFLFAEMLEASRKVAEE